MNLKEYIYPIYSGGTIVGQGFLADGYFITAAHVVEDFPRCFTRINEKFFGFSHFNPGKRPVFIGEGNIHHDPTMIDVAIYPFDDIISPLKLISYTPPKGDEFDSYSMHEVIDFTTLNPPCELRKVPATACGAEEGNYFYCNCKQYGGSSGSPLIRGNQVIGIMHGGDGEGLCAFLKSEVVSKIISRKELSLDYDEWDLEQAWEYKGCKYSNDKKRLLSGNGDTILEGTLVICNEAFLKNKYDGRAYDDVVIPNSVKIIGDQAFAWSRGLSRIVMSDSVIQIGKGVFYGCSFLRSVVLSKSLTEISNGMFSGCQSLRDITIPCSVARIGEDAFDGCESLSNIVIPPNVTSIGYTAFFECTSLAQVIFLGTVENIDDNIFEGCSSLSQILIPFGTFDKYKEMLPDYTDILVEDDFIGKVANPLEWSPLGEKFTLEEICKASCMFNINDVDGEEAEIIASEFSDGSTSLRICIPFKDGSFIELKAGKAILEGFNEGDKVKITLIYGQELKKVGSPSIVRYDVWKSEEEKNKYLEERGEV